MHTRIISGVELLESDTFGKILSFGRAEEKGLVHSNRDDPLAGASTISISSGEFWRMVRLIHSAAVVALILAPSAYAEEKAKGTPGSKEIPKSKIARKRADERQRILDKYDQDKDGKLSETERQILRADLLKSRLSKTGGKRNPQTARLLQLFDKNKDGKLDDKEKSAARKAIAKRRQQYMKRLQQQMRRGKGGRGGRGASSRGRSRRGASSRGRGGRSAKSRGRRGAGGNSSSRRLQQLRKRMLQQQKQRRRKK